MDGVLQKSFASEESFSHVLKESFEAVVKDKKSRPAELLAKVRLTDCYCFGTI